MKIRKKLRNLSFRKWKITNENTGQRQSFWKGKIKGEKYIVKKPKGGAKDQQKYREILKKNLAKIQGKTYELKLSRRMYHGEKVIEKYYDLPTQAQIEWLAKKEKKTRSVRDFYQNYLYTKQAKKLAKRNNLSPQELSNIVKLARTELNSRINNLPKIYSIDFAQGNQLIDMEKGKIIFRMIDY
jgi:hypothetical protein